MRPPFTEAQFEIRWSGGVGTLSELIDQGVNRGIIATIEGRVWAEGWVRAVVGAQARARPRPRKRQ
jgi:hypothetical protein